MSFIKEYTGCVLDRPVAAAFGPLVGIYLKIVCCQLLIQNVFYKFLKWFLVSNNFWSEVFLSFRAK